MDDLGPGTPSTYGGEINTPNLSRIANAGISYNRFHSTANVAVIRNGAGNSISDATAIAKLLNRYYTYKFNRSSSLTSDTM